MTFPIHLSMMSPTGVIRLEGEGIFGIGAIAADVNALISQKKPSEQDRLPMGAKAASPDFFVVF